MYAIWHRVGGRASSLILCRSDGKEGVLRSGKLPTRCKVRFNDHAWRSEHKLFTNAGVDSSFVTGVVTHTKALFIMETERNQKFYDTNCKFYVKSLCHGSSLTCSLLNDAKSQRFAPVVPDTSPGQNSGKCWEKTVRPRSLRSLSQRYSSVTGPGKAAIRAKVFFDIDNCFRVGCGCGLVPALVFVLIRSNRGLSGSVWATGQTTFKNPAASTFDFTFVVRPSKVQCCIKVTFLSNRGW